MNTEAKSIWQGRFDGEGEEHRRFYQAISAQADVDFSLFGFACDEGVRRNQGRIGAAAAPDAIRRQLANFALHHNIRITDKGNVSCEQGDLEGAQSVLAQKITDTLAYHSMPIIFGGGHEVAFASFKGLFDYLQTQPQTGNIGIINIDAHFDLRHAFSTSRTDFAASRKKLSLSMPRYRPTQQYRRFISDRICSQLPLSSR